MAVGEWRRQRARRVPADGWLRDRADVWSLCVWEAYSPAGMRRPTCQPLLQANFRNLAVRCLWQLS